LNLALRNLSFYLAHSMRPPMLEHFPTAQFLTFSTDTSISDCLHLALDLAITLAKFHFGVNLLCWRHTHPSLFSFMTVLFESPLPMFMMSFSYWSQPICTLVRSETCSWHIHPLPHIMDATSNLARGLQSTSLLWWSRAVGMRVDVRQRYRTEARWGVRTSMRLDGLKHTRTRTILTPILIPACTCHLQTNQQPTNWLTGWLVIIQTISTWMELEPHSTCLWYTTISGSPSLSSLHEDLVWPTSTTDPSIMRLVPIWASHHQVTGGWSGWPLLFQPCHQHLVHLWGRHCNKATLD